MPKGRASATLIQTSRRKSPAEKAAYHEVLGAGRSRVRRPFFGLTEDDASAISARIDAGLRLTLAKTA